MHGASQEQENRISAAGTTESDIETKVDQDANDSQEVDEQIAHINARIKQLDQDGITNPRTNEHLQRWENYINENDENEKEKLLFELYRFLISDLLSIRNTKSELDDFLMYSTEEIALLEAIEAFVEPSINITKFGRYLQRRTK